MAYKDKDKQRQAVKASVKRHRDQQKGITQGSESTTTVIPLTLTDACGKVHKIDYEGWAKDRALLESWAKGEGMEYQRSLGILAMKYSQINGVACPGSQEIMDADTVYCRRKTG